MNINFVSYLNPFHFSGGGEQYTQRIISEGRRRGHTIRLVSVQPFGLMKQLMQDRFSNPDLWILFDVYNCPDDRRRFDRAFIDDIIASGRYVLGQNAYGDICPLDALPCNGNISDGVRCVENEKVYYSYRGHKRRRSKWQKGHCTVRDNQRLFSKALLDIFLSPLHAKVFIGLYPDIAAKVYILKPLVDMELFFDTHSARDIRYASYNGQGETKGFYNILTRFPHEKVVFFGHSNGGFAKKYGFGELYGRIPYDQMPAFLNRVEHLIHLPRWPEPHGLIINQAALCGCKLITNDMVGALTHSFDMLDRSSYPTHAAQLWQALENIMAD